MKRFWGLLFAFLALAPAETQAEKIWDKINPPSFHKDMATKEAEYIKKVEKNRIKEEYGRKKLDIHPSGYMSVEEYETLSSPTDKAVIDYGKPQVTKPYDMEFVPDPIYKLARYNDPPGSPELSIKRELFQTRQLNLPGITSPDFTLMVYPAVYYYPERGAVSCDLFMVPLRDNDSSVNKILKANIANRYPKPILSTDKELSNSSAFRTLTPIDFSADSSKLLVKEKIGSSADGIWQTRAIIYDFNTKTTYDLVELRSAIEYYWKQYKGLHLNDKRWDIYPLGFSKGNPHRIMVTAYAYTGEEPIFLGVWSIDSKGEQSRLISLRNGSIEVASNGFKLVQEGVVNHALVNKQEKDERKLVKKEASKAKKQDRDKIKALNREQNKEIKELNKEYRMEQQEKRILDKMKGTTTQNENLEKYEEKLEELYEKRRIKVEKAEEKQQQKEVKQQEKEQKRQEKADERLQKRIEKEQEEIQKAKDAAQWGEPEMDLDNINFDEI